MAIDRLWLVNVTAMNTQTQNLFELFVYLMSYKGFGKVKRVYLMTMK